MFFFIVLCVLKATDECPKCSRRVPQVTQKPYMSAPSAPYECPKCSIRVPQVPQTSAASAPKATCECPKCPRRVPQVPQMSAPSAPVPQIRNKVVSTTQVVPKAQKVGAWVSNKIFMKPTLVETQRERETSQLIPYSLDSTVTHWPISVSESLMYNK